MVRVKEKEKAVMDERKTMPSHATWVKSPLLMFVPTVQIGTKVLHSDFTVETRNLKPNVKIMVT